MRRLAVPSVLLLVCALVGCAPLEFEPSSPTAPAVSPKEQTELERKRGEAVEGQRWADQLMEAYWLRDDSSVQLWMLGTAERQIVSWGASKPGELELSVNGSEPTTDRDLKYFALRLLEEFGDPSLKSVTVSVLGTEVSVVARTEELDTSQA